MQLRTEIAAMALVRRATSSGVFAAVLAKGDPDAGAILVKVNTLDGRAQVHSPMLNHAGETTWITPLGEPAPPEAKADAYIARRRDNDPDIWVIEVEDRAGRPFVV